MRGVPKHRMFFLTMMKRVFSASVWKEGEWYVAQCLDVDVASQGETEAAAMENLREALRLHFRPPRATVVHNRINQDRA